MLMVECGGVFRSEICDFVFLGVLFYDFVLGIFEVVVKFSFIVGVIWRGKLV